MLNNAKPLPTTGSVSRRNRVRDADRAIRRAAVGAGMGALAGLVCGGPLGGIAGVVYERALAAVEVSMILGLFAGGVCGLLIGPVVIIKHHVHRLTAAVLVGALSAGFLGASLANTIGHFHDSPPVGGRDYWVLVCQFTVIGIMAGGVGGLLVGLFLGMLRARWTWLTRWDAAADSLASTPLPKGNAPERAAAGNR